MLDLAIKFCFACAAACMVAAYVLAFVYFSREEEAKLLEGTLCGSILSFVFWNLIGAVLWAFS